ncbi:MAG: hypothetical protein IKY52_14460 [Clostridia bacterium]|nr:hypothetical protein [Clostridia bacterium]
MAFNIESFKKNFKDVTDKTVKKTGELTTIAKLNMSIKAEEAKLSDCYKAIGRLFYTAERDNLDNTEEIATYIMQADKIKAVIADCQKELALLRNVVICEGCNNEISGDCIFCPICGLKVTKPVAEPAEEVCECDEECACECACEDAPAEECNCECECTCEEAPAEECCCEGECTCEEEPKAE